MQARDRQAVVLEQTQNTGGLGRSFPIAPLTKQQQPLPEQEGQPYAPLPAEGVEMPEDRVSLSGPSGEALYEFSDEVRDGFSDEVRDEFSDEVRDELSNEVRGKHAATSEVEHPHEGEFKNGAPESKVSGDEASEDDSLDAEAEEQVRDLKQRDAEVKAHEQAHMAAGGGLVQGAANYTYEKGPDGGMYAVGGEVKIDTSPAKTPDQTIAKMQQVRRAALAPAQPSATDRSVAAQASQIEAQARSEKASEPTEEEKENLASAGLRPSTKSIDEGDEPTQATPAGPFTTPANQAYQAATATSGTARQRFSTFV